MLPTINHRIVFIIRVNTIVGNVASTSIYIRVFLLFFLTFRLINWCTFYSKPRSGSDILTGRHGGLLVALSRPRSDVDSIVVRKSNTTNERPDYQIKFN